MRDFRFLNSPPLGGENALQNGCDIVMPWTECEKKIINARTLL